MPPKVASSSRAVATSAAQKVSNRVLPAKEAALFKQLFQQFETKQWKKGIKTADTILKTVPDHGETLAMKGLLFSCSDRKAEGYELAKRGVRMDMQSHIVWHVYGIMYRADKNYEEALKCYNQAHKIDKDSLNILSDLALLTVHLRHYAAYAEHRLSILRTAPRLRRNWVGLAVAQHLAGQLSEADKTLTSYEEMLREVPDQEYEHSDVLLYHASLLNEKGEYEKCLEFLGEHAREIVDRLAYSVLRAHLLLKLGRQEPAEWAWEVLLEQNPDNHEYIKSYILAKGADADATTEEGRAAAIKVLDVLAEKYPQSLSIRRIALDIVSGEEFKTKLTAYLTSALLKGIPSIFADLKALYSDPTKRAVIGDLATTMYTSLVTTSTFVPTPSPSQDLEPTSALVWTLYYLAQHHSHRLVDSQALALEYINKAIEHTPSLPELYGIKARILRRAGDPIEALKAMSEARSLDGQDRYLNSKNAKYFLRADLIDEAEDTVGLFTKKDAVSPLADLIEMQCLWFIQEEGASYSRQHKYALALKRFHQIFAIFDEIEEDQYDFHTYCLRKSTLRAYIQLLRFVHELRSHPRYFGAAKGAIEIYLRIHDDPASVLPPVLSNGALEAASHKAKIDEAKKAEKQKEKEAEKAAQLAKNKKAGKKVEEEEVPVVVVDSDPLGEKLFQTKTPLEEALKALKPLEKAAPNDINTWLLSYQVAIRREKHLQALRALQTAFALDPTSADLHPFLIQFSLATSSSSLPDLNPAVRATIDATLPGLLQGLDPARFNAEMVQRNEGSAKHLVAAAKGLVFLGMGKAPEKEVEELLLQMLREGITPALEPTLEAFQLFKDHALPRIEEFRIGAAKRFPFAFAFKSLAEQDAARKSLFEASVVEVVEGKEVLE